MSIDSGQVSAIDRASSRVWSPEGKGPTGGLRDRIGYALGSVIEFPFKGMTTSSFGPQSHYFNLFPETMLYDRYVLGPVNCILFFSFICAHDLSF